MRPWSIKQKNTRDPQLENCLHLASTSIYLAFFAERLNSLSLFPLSLSQADPSSSSDEAEERGRYLQMGEGLWNQTFSTLTKPHSCWDSSQAIFGHMPGTAVGAPILHCPDPVPEAVGKIRMRCRLADRVTVINGRGRIPTLSLLLFHLQELLSLPQPAPRQGSGADGKRAGITTMEILGENQKYRRVFSCKRGFWGVGTCLYSQLCPKHQPFYITAGSQGVQCGKLTGVSNFCPYKSFVYLSIFRMLQFLPSLLVISASSFLPQIPSDIIMVVIKLLINSRCALLSLFS